MLKRYVLILAATLVCPAYAAQEYFVDPRAPKEYINSDNLIYFMQQKDGTFMKLTRQSVNEHFGLSEEEKKNR